MSTLGDELVRHCWHLLHSGQPHRALLIAERALRIYHPPADSVLSGRLSLIVGVALAALGRDAPARRYLEDASWSLAHAGDRDDTAPPPDASGAAGASGTGASGVDEVMPLGGPVPG